MNRMFVSETAWTDLARIVRWDSNARERFNGWIAFLGYKSVETLRFVLHDSGVLTRLMSVFTDAYISRNMVDARQVGSAIFALASCLCVDETVPRVLVDMGIFHVMSRVWNRHARGLLRRMVFRNPQFVVPLVQACTPLMDRLRRRHVNHQILSYMYHEATRAGDAISAGLLSEFRTIRASKRMRLSREAEPIFRAHRAIRYRLCKNRALKQTVVGKLLLSIMNGRPCDEVRDRLVRNEPGRDIRITGAKICFLMYLFDAFVKRVDNSEHWSGVRTVLLS